MGSDLLSYLPTMMGYGFSAALVMPRTTNAERTAIKRLYAEGRLSMDDIGAAFHRQVFDSLDSSCERCDFLILYQ